MAYSSIGYNLNMNANISTVVADTTPQFPTNALYSNSLTIGNAAGQADQVIDQVVIVASSGSPGSIDVTTALNTAGVAAAMLHVVALEVFNLDATQTFTVKPAASQGVTFLPTLGIVLPPGGKLFLAFDQIPGGAAVAGAAVVASTSDTIGFSIGAGTNIQCKVTIFGRDA